LRWALVDKIGLFEFATQIRNAAAIYAQVRVAQARSRAYGNPASGRIPKKLQIINKSEQPAFNLGVQVMIGMRNDCGAWQPADDIGDTFPGCGRITLHLQGRHVVPGVRGFRGDAIGFMGTIAQSYRGLVSFWARAFWAGYFQYNQRERQA